MRVPVRQEDSYGYLWYAIRTKPQFEKRVAVGLQGKGYEQFLPVRRVRRQKSDRAVVVEYPLFSGYLFCRFDAMKRLPVLTTPGVIYIVSTSERLCPVPNEEIASLRKIVHSGLAIYNYRYLPGTKIRITTGPLAGVKGIVVRTNDNCRIVISVDTLQRSVAVEIGSDCLAMHHEH